MRLLCYRLNTHTQSIVFRHPNELHFHLSFNFGGHWGTTGDFTTSFLHFSLFSTVLWDLGHPPQIPTLNLPKSHCLPQKVWLACYMMHFLWNKTSSLSNTILVCLMTDYILVREDVEAEETLRTRVPGDTLTAMTHELLPARSYRFTVQPRFRHASGPQSWPVDYVVHKELIEHEERWECSSLTFSRVTAIRQVETVRWRGLFSEGDDYWQPIFLLSGIDRTFFIFFIMFMA